MLTPRVPRREALSQLRAREVGLRSVEERAVGSAVGPTNSAVGTDGTSVNVAAPVLPQDPAADARVTGSGLPREAGGAEGGSPLRAERYCFVPI